jgi:capsular polysaccharide biosynthesis protein
MKAKGEDSYEKWLVELVSKHYETNTLQSEEYLKILYNTRKGREWIKELCETYGIETKQITKLKLNI